MLQGFDLFHNIVGQRRLINRLLHKQSGTSKSTVAKLGTSRAGSKKHQATRETARKQEKKT
jgi:hypothetical protein